MTALISLPSLTVIVDGAPLGEAGAGALGEVLIRHSLSLPSACELTFYEPPAAVYSVGRLAPGVSIEIRANGHGDSLFNGQVTAINHSYGPDRGQQLGVRCYDRLHQLRKRQPVRAHAQQTLAQLARVLVSDLGLEVETTYRGPVWRQIVQHHQSDLDLLREWSERCGLYFTLHEGVLHLLTLEGFEVSPVPLVLGRSLLEVEFEVNADPACRRVETLAWDPWHVEERPGNASEARVGRRVGAEVPTEPFGHNGLRTLANRTVQDSAQADAMAQAELDRRVAGEITLSGIAQGDPRLRPGICVDVQGVAEDLAGRFVLTEVVHRIDRRRGFLSEIGTAPPLPTERHAAAQMAFGTVSQVDDPETLGRVRVTLPCYGGIESEWLEVMLPAAGPGKGLVALPDVGDRVLVLFARDEPAQGVVLGGLFGSEPPPDAGGVEDGGIRRYHFMTPGGQRFVLDDAAGIARIETEGGDYVHLSPQAVRVGDGDGSFVEFTSRRVRLHAEADLQIEAPGKAVVVRGRSIDFESA